MRTAARMRKYHRKNWLACRYREAFALHKAISIKEG